MWIDEVETKEIGVSGEEIVIKKVGRDYSYRFANEAGDWITGLPHGLVWGDAQALFEDSL
jgi:hypothetical protein